MSALPNTVATVLFRKNICLDAFFDCSFICRATGLNHTPRGGERRQQKTFSRHVPCPSLANHEATRFAPGKEKGGEAPKGALQPWPRHTDKRHRLPTPGRGGAPLLEARPPSGALPRHSPPAITPMALLQTRVSRESQAHRCFACLPLASVKHAPCGPVLLPVDRCPRAARD